MSTEQLGCDQKDKKGVLEMIRCEVRVPACGKSYEFILNEYVKIPMVIAELASIISSYERRSWAKANEKQELLLAAEPCCAGRFFE